MDGIESSEEESTRPTEEDMKYSEEAGATPEQTTDSVEKETIDAGIEITALEVPRSSSEKKTNRRRPSVLT